MQGVAGMGWHPEQSLSVPHSPAGAVGRARHAQPLGDVDSVPGLALPGWVALAPSVLARLTFPS